MNILHITNIGSCANGIGSVLICLEKEQRLLGHNVKVVSLRENKIYKNTQIIHINNLADFQKEIDDFQPDIAIFHSLYWTDYLRFAKYLNNKKIPYLIMLHGALSKENYKKSHWKKFIANLLCFNKFIKQAKFIIYLNKAEYNNAIVPKINPNYMIIPNGCNLPKNVTLHTINDRIEILYLGRIERVHKGLDILIEALKILKQEKANKFVYISFYGDSLDKEELEWFKTAIEPLEDICNFYGSAYGEEKDKAYRNTDIFILTSRSEGMPMGVLEALSYGKPCLITPQTNMANIINKYRCGWVTELQPQAIAETIVKACEEYREKAESFFNNSLSTSKEFSWKEIAKKSIEEYNKIITFYDKKN